MEFVFCALSVLSAADWPQFRGPEANGHVIGMTVPLEWSETKNVAWKVNIPGLGWSSPAIVNGRVYLTTAVPRGAGLSLRAMCLDAESGKVVWDHEVRSLETAPAIHKKNSHASPTPIVQDGCVYVHFGTHGTACLSALDGTLQWLNLDLEYNPLHGNGGTPMLHSGLLVVACDGTKEPYVAAINARNGRLAWKTPRSVEARLTHSFGTAAVTEVDGQVQVLIPGPDHFAAYELATGKELYKVLAPGWSVVPQPAVGHGMVFYNHDYDNPELMAVRLGGTGDVTETNVVWRITKGAPSTPSPLLIGDELYFVSDTGIASCVNAHTGEAHWVERLGGNFSASPVFVNGRILFLDEDGLATWVNVGTTFEQMGQNQLPGRTFATPAFAHNAMYLRTDSTLYKFAEQ